jgi:hypothetical protein
MPSDEAILGTGRMSDGPASGPDDAGVDDRDGSFAPVAPPSLVPRPDPPLSRLLPAMAPPAPIC